LLTSTSEISLTIINSFLVPLISFRLGRCPRPPFLVPQRKKADVCKTLWTYTRPLLGGKFAMELLVVRLAPSLKTIPCLFPPNCDSPSHPFRSGSDFAPMGATYCFSWIGVVVAMVPHKLFFVHRLTPSPHLGFESFFYNWQSAGRRQRVITDQGHPEFLGGVLGPDPFHPIF